MLNYHIIACISHTSKVILKILQVRLQQYMNCDLPDAQAVFRKGRGNRDQIANVFWIIKKWESSRKKKIYFCFIDYAKVFHMYGSQQTVENSSKMGILTTLPASWDICMQVKKQQLQLDMEKQTGSKSGKAYIKVVYCHPAYLTYIQSTSWEMLDWMKQKLDSRLPG